MTNKKRYAVYVNERIEEEIENFRYDHRFATASSAVEELIRIGLYALKQEKAEEERRNNSK